MYIKEKIIIAAGPVIIKDNKVLLVRHGDKGRWKFPGGKVEFDDITDWQNALEQTAIREAEEELGVDIEIIRPLKPMLVPRPDHSGEYAILIHFLEKFNGKIRPGEDIDDWQWFSLNDLPDNCATNIKPVIDEYLKLSN